MTKRVSSFSRSVAAALRGYMEERGITQRDVVAHTGKSQGYVSEHLSGKRAPDGDLIDAVADLANVESQWLLGLIRDRLAGTETAAERQREEESVEDAAARLTKAARDEVRERPSPEPPPVVKPTRRKRSGSS